MRHYTRNHLNKETGYDCRKRDDTYSHSQTDAQTMKPEISTRRGWLVLSMMAAPALLADSARPAKAAAAAGTSGQLQYNNNGNLAGTPDVFFQPAAGSNATALFVVNENNTEAGDFQPRNFIAVEASNTDHSAHFTGYKSRGSYANPIPVQAGDFITSFVPFAYVPNGNYQGGGYYSHVVDDVSSGNLSAHAEIGAVTNGGQG